MAATAPPESQTGSCFQRQAERVAPDAVHPLLRIRMRGGQGAGRPTRRPGHGDEGRSSSRPPVSCRTGCTRRKNEAAPQTALAGQPRE